MLLSAPTATAQRHRQPLPDAGHLLTIEDTVRAVRRLFNGRDASGTTRLAVNVGVLSSVGVGALLPAPFGRPNLKQSVIGVGVLTGGVGVGLGLRQMLRFSSRHRDQVVAAYLQGEPLPGYVRRRLRPEHFQAGKR